MFNADTGVWVEDGSDQFLRDGLRFRVTVTPTATTALVSYPDATEACADPDQTAVDLQIEKTASNESRPRAWQDGAAHPRGVPFASSGIAVSAAQPQQNGTEMSLLRR